MTFAQALVSATCAAVAVALLVPARSVPDGPPSGRPPHGSPPLLVPLVGVMSVGAAAVLLDGSRLVAGLAGVLACVGIARSVRERRAARTRARHRALVVEVGEAMVGELRAGRPHLHALGRAGEVWPALEPVVAAARLGSDVPRALREVARRPGAEGLADLAAAWQVSTSSGAALASSLAHVVASARAREHASTLVAAELASARATARLVALLPIGTLAMASGLGPSPWRFLVGSPVGAACLLAGVALVVAGLAWIDRIAGSVEGR